MMLSNGISLVNRDLFFLSSREKDGKMCQCFVVVISKLRENPLSYLHRFVTMINALERLIIHMCTQSSFRSFVFGCHGLWQTQQNCWPFSNHRNAFHKFNCFLFICAFWDWHFSFLSSWDSKSNDSFHLTKPSAVCVNINSFQRVATLMKHILAI